MLLNYLNKILKGETALNTTMLTTITIYTPVTVCNQLFVNCMLLWSYSRDMCVLHTMLAGVPNKSKHRVLQAMRHLAPEASFQKCDRCFETPLFERHPH